MRSVRERVAIAPSQRISHFAQAVGARRRVGHDAGLHDSRRALAPTNPDVESGIAQASRSIRSMRARRGASAAIAGTKASIAAGVPQAWISTSALSLATHTLAPTETSQSGVAQSVNAKRVELEASPRPSASKVRPTEVKANARPGKRASHHARDA